MPDTPGKRQRREVKAKKRQAREERRDARKAKRNDPNAEPTEWLADEQYVRNVGGEDGGRPLPATADRAPESGETR
jgi:hypothetical protein